LPTQQYNDGTRGNHTNTQHNTDTIYDSSIISHTKRYTHSDEYSGAN